MSIYPLFMVVKTGVLTNFIFCFSLLISLLVAMAIPVRGAKLRSMELHLNLSFLSRPLDFIDFPYN
ncbi:hypothetical protein GEX06_10940 [Salmonella enterica]|nr:hypothetical protein [Salmonella enterica]